MISIFGTWVGHRVILLCVALFVVYRALPPEMANTPNKFSVVKEQLVKKIVERQETQRLVESSYYRASDPIDALRTPFQTIYRAFLWVTGMTPVFGLFLLSNIFFWLFILELFAVLSRVHTSAQAMQTAILVIFLPTSFEMNLASSFSFVCFLAMLAIHQALESRWLMAGIVAGVLALADPLSILLVPLLLYIFFYFQQGQIVRLVWKRALMFLVPVVLAMVLDFGSYAQLGDALSRSSLAYLFSSISGGGLKETLAHSPIGMSLVIGLLVVGTVGAFLNNPSMVHKIIPIYMLAFVLLTSPFGRLSFRLPMAGLCLQGIIPLAGKMATWIILVVLLGLGIFEVSAAL